MKKKPVSIQRQSLDKTSLDTETKLPLYVILLGIYLRFKEEEKDEEKENPINLNSVWNGREKKYINKEGGDHTIL